MNLNQAETFDHVDKSGMLRMAMSWPQDIEHAVDLARKLVIPKTYRKFSRIVVAGMGGSAIPGDFVKALSWRELSVPLVVNRDYALPGFAGQDALVFAISYSGGTEETITAFQEAVQRGAHVIALTSGGKLLELCQEHGVPCIALPTGRQTRASFVYLFFPLLVTLQRLGVVPNKDKDIEETVKVVEGMVREFGPSVPVAGNAAKALATKLHDKSALIFGTHCCTDVVALRWKQQINENAKSPARYEVFPELNHNETVSWRAPRMMQDNIEAIFMRDGAESPQIKKRIEVTQEFLNARSVGYSNVWSRGDSMLARLSSLSYFSDFTSLYLALLGEVDPGPVEAINYFKQRLAAE